MHIVYIFLLYGYYLQAAKAAKSTFYGLIFDMINKDATENVNKTIKAAEEMTLDELGISRGACFNNFLTYIAYEDNDFCYVDDEYILHLLPPSTASVAIPKPPIMVKCLDEHPLLKKGEKNKLRMMESAQEVVDLLKPVGNNTKRYEPGSCVLVYFYTPSCLACTISALPVNALPHAFPSLPVAAINAYKYPSFNAEFGIVALPTLMLFHQGRPIIKYRAEVKFDTFVTRHTGLPSTPYPKYYALTPLPMEVEYETDYVLILAWLFILVCASYHFSQSALCKQIVDVIKRNWRESEAQLEQQT